MNLLDIFFPKRCVGCGKIGGYFCTQCTHTMRGIDTPICPICEKPAIDGITHPKCRTRYTLDGLTSFFRYDGIVKKAVKTLKYRFVSDLCKEFISLVPDKSLTAIRTIPRITPEIFIPIPLHSSRLRFRGFNQAEVLGLHICARLKIPMRTDILYRVRKTVPQVEMKDKHMRMINTERAFRLSSLPLTDLQPSVVLFDDVFTTGATMRHAASALKHGGVKHVWAVTMAR